MPARDPKTGKFIKGKKKGKKKKKASSGGGGGRRLPPNVASKPNINGANHVNPSTPFTHTSGNVFGGQRVPGTTTTVYPRGKLWTM